EGSSVPRERGLPRILQPLPRFQRIADQAGHQPAERHMLLACFFSKLLQKIGGQGNHHLSSRVHDQSPLAINLTNLLTGSWTLQSACQALGSTKPIEPERTFCVGALIQCDTLSIET